MLLIEFDQTDKNTILYNDWHWPLTTVKFKSHRHQQRLVCQLIFTRHLYKHTSDDHSPLCMHSQYDETRLHGKRMYRQTLLPYLIAKTSKEYRSCRTFELLTS